MGGQVTLVGFPLTPRPGAPRAGAKAVPLLQRYSAASIDEALASLEGEANTHDEGDFPEDTTRKAADEEIEPSLNAIREGDDSFNGEPTRPGDKAIMAKMAALTRSPVVKKASSAPRAKSRADQNLFPGERTNVEKKVPQNVGTAPAVGSDSEEFPVVSTRPVDPAELAQVQEACKTDATPEENQSKRKKRKSLFQQLFKRGAGSETEE
jgi:hypothetical protein